MISNNAVYRNNVRLFERSNTSINSFLLAAYQFLGVKYPKFYKMDNLAKLGWLAVEVLLKEGFKAGNYKETEIGVVLANASSSLDADIKYYDTVKDVASPALFVYTLPNIVIGEICIRNHFKGENAFFIFEDFDAGFMQKYVANLLNNNILQVCICGWVELLKEDYKAVLFLVEKDKGDRPTSFTIKNMNKIYQLKNG